MTDVTLATHVRVLDPVPIKDLFAECRRLLGAGPEIPIIEEFAHEYGGTPDRSARVLRHDPGMGLAAWLIVTYAIERPLPTELDAEEMRETGEAIVPHFVDVKFDSSYFVGGHVHAHLVTELGVWLATRGARFQWRDEYSGTWYDALASLDTLGDSERGADLCTEVQA